MAAALPVAQYVAVLRDGGDRLLADALTAGLQAKVPTCRTWTAAHLVAHQAVVHRWALAVVTNAADQRSLAQTAVRQRPDLVEFYRDGLTQLCAAIKAAPDDLDVMTFLADVTSPRVFWARRQAHEVTMHGVDALSARLGHVPTTDECGIAAAFAADGLDELLRGFYSRGKSKIADATPYTFVVAPTDVTQRWVVHVGEQLEVAAAGTPEPADVRMRLTGTAAGLYLALWNRGTDVVAEGDSEVLARWRREQRIRWS